jgi:hypothetical protein
MSFVSASEIHSGRTAEGSVSKAQSIRHYNRVFRSVCDNPYDDAVVATSGIPIMYGSPYPNDYGAWCNKVSCRNDDKARTVWLCTYEYSSERSIDENPLNDPPEIEWDTVVHEKGVSKDRDGKAILNSAGDYFSTPIKCDDSRWAVTVKRNLPWVPQWILDYRDSINGDSFVVDGVSVSKGQAKMSSIKIGNWQKRNNTAFRVVSLTLHIVDGDGWDAQIQDMGLKAYFDSDNGTIKIDCFDKVGNHSRTPQPLDGSGYQIPEPITPDKVQFITAKIYKQMPFSSLPLV